MLTRTSLTSATRAALVVAVLTASVHALASDGYEALQKKLKALMPGITIDSVHETPVPGVLEILSGNDVAYVTADGNYVFQGILFDLRQRNNLTERRRDVGRSKVMASIEEKDLIVYSAGDAEKASITVFTDPSCPYCKRLHNEIPALNALGVTVRYALYAREGIGSPVGVSIKSAVCMKDKKAAVDQIMNGQSLSPTQDCDYSAVERLHRAAQTMNIEGTPYIVMETGRAMPGYRPAREMAKAVGVL